MWAGRGSKAVDQEHSGGTMADDGDNNSKEPTEKTSLIPLPEAGVTVPPRRGSAGKPSVPPPGRGPGTVLRGDPKRSRQRPTVQQPLTSREEDDASFFPAAAPRLSGIAPAPGPLEGWELLESSTEDTPPGIALPRAWLEEDTSVSVQLPEAREEPKLKIVGPEPAEVSDLSIRRLEQKLEALQREVASLQGTGTIMLEDRIDAVGAEVGEKDAELSKQERRLSELEAFLEDFVKEERAGFVELRDRLDSLGEALRSEVDSVRGELGTTSPTPAASPSPEVWQRLEGLRGFLEESLGEVFRRLDALELAFDASRATAARRHPLEELRGIGEKYAHALVAEGLDSVGALAGLSDEALPSKAEALRIGEAKLRRWRDEARRSLP